jgi:uncharacterized protein (TIGR02996 family)
MADTNEREIMRAEENSYIDNILADPRSPGPRLAYADWLNSQNNREREEYLRLQCQQTHFLNPSDSFWESGGAVHHRDDQTGPAECEQRAIADRLRQLEEKLDAGWFVWVLEDFAPPPGLSARGMQASRIILGVLAKKKAAKTGAVQLFRTPEWGIEGGLIKQGSLVVLFVVYDVWLQTYFEYVPHRSGEKLDEAAMAKALRREGFFAESDGFGRAMIVDTATDRMSELDIPGK